METPDDAAAAAPDPGRDAEATRQDPVSALLADLGAIAHDQLGLVALEARRAGISLVAMLVYGLMVFVMIATAWLVAQAALLLALLDHGVAASVALVVLALCNLLGVTVLASKIRQRSADLQFPATRRSLAPRSRAPSPPAQ